MRFQTLATRGVGGYRQYRIPAMAVTPTGRIIAIYDARADLDDLPGPIDLVIRFSDDNGNTWSEQKLFGKHEGITGYGDAGILIDPSVGQTGRILVLNQVTQLAGFFESSPGVDPDDPTVAQIELSISDDDGKTWSHKYITEQLKNESTPGIFATSGMGSRISTGKYDGRLLHTFVIRRGNTLLAAIGYSDDHGLNWKLGAEIPGGNETAIIGLPDGSILLHSRATPFRLSGSSTDGGQTLNELGPDLALPDPSDNGSLALLDDGAIICTHNHDSDLRRFTVVKKSYDNGKTWPEVAILEVGSSAYSTACQLEDGSIGVLFERNGYSELVFAKVESEDFVSAEALKPATEVEFTIALRFIQPARMNVIEKKSEIAPKVDMTKFRFFEGKEVAKRASDIGAEILYTSAEFDQMMGPISPGFHLGDEIRFSGRLANNSTNSLSDVEIKSSIESFKITKELLNPGEKIVFLDLRHIVTAAEIAAGKVQIKFNWSSKTLSGELIQEFSTATGELL